MVFAVTGVDPPRPAPYATRPGGPLRATVGRPVASGAMSRLRVAVFGAAGRMGSTVCGAVIDDPDLELVAAVDPHHAGIDLRQVSRLDTDLVIEPDAGRIVASEAEVAVDFTLIDAARENLRLVRGQRGPRRGRHQRLTDDDLDGRASCSPPATASIAPNFAIGAVLMMHFAELAAPWFETADIVETHHDAKIDAPSGTAVAHRGADGGGLVRVGRRPDHAPHLEGPGAAGRGGIHLHSLRVRGTVAHQEVVLGTTGQTLTIRHDSYDRSRSCPACCWP